MTAQLPLKVFTRLYISIGAFLFILLTGTVGYTVIEHYSPLEALFMTVITLSTVGYQEVRPLSDMGKIFTVILIIANIGTFTYFLTQISSYFLDGEFSKEYKSYKMKHKIAELENHVIICGFGRNGREAAKIFHKNGYPFVVIEKHPFKRGDLTFPIDYYIEGDATHDEVFLETGIKGAAALISTLPDDADNLLVVLTARELNHQLKIISRASNDSTVRKLKIAGADNVIMPDKIGGAHMASSVISSDMTEFVDLLATQINEHFSLIEIEAKKTITIEELNSWRNTGATVLGIKVSIGEYLLNPSPTTIIRPGHRVIAMGSKEQIERLMNQLA